MNGLQVQMGEPGGKAWWVETRGPWTVQKYRYLSLSLSWKDEWAALWTTPVGAVACRFARLGARKHTPDLAKGLFGQLQIKKSDFSLFFFWRACGKYDSERIKWKSCWRRFQVQQHKRSFRPSKWLAHPSFLSADRCNWNTLCMAPAVVPPGHNGRPALLGFSISFTENKSTKFRRLHRLFLVSDREAGQVGSVCEYFGSGQETVKMPRQKSPHSTKARRFSCIHTKDTRRLTAKAHHISRRITLLVYYVGSKQWCASMTRAAVNSSQRHRSRVLCTSVFAHPGDSISCRDKPPRGCE